MQVGILSEDFHPFEYGLLQILGDNRYIRLATLVELFSSLSQKKIDSFLLEIEDGSFGLNAKNKEFLLRNEEIIIEKEIVIQREIYVAKFIPISAGPIIYFFAVKKEDEHFTEILENKTLPLTSSNMETVVYYFGEEWKGNRNAVLFASGEVMNKMGINKQATYLKKIAKRYLLIKRKEGEQN